MGSLFKVKKPGTYDFALALATIAVLAALSAVFIYGTIESWINYINNPRWTMSWLYPDYLGRMNSYAYPFVVALVLILCMCIPKRFIPRNYLLQLSLILLALSFMVGIIWGFVAGLGFLLIISAIIQAVVVVAVMARSGSLVFEREGLMVQLGSALLHLGFVVLILDLVLIKDIQSHLSVFWFSTALITFGSVLSFYSRELSLVLHKANGRQEGIAASPETEGEEFDDEEFIEEELDDEPSVTDIPVDDAPAYKSED